VTGISDTAALAAIGAAARELKLPTVRADAARLAEIGHSGSGFDVLGTGRSIQALT
jgi:hypothetical protein